MSQNYYSAPPNTKKYSRWIRHSPESGRQNYNKMYSFKQILDLIFLAFQRTIIYRFFRSNVLVSILILIAVIIVIMNDIRENPRYDFLFNRTSEETTQSQPHINNAVVPITANNLVLSFVVGKHSGSRGTFIEINDGKSEIASGVFKEGTKMEFYKDKKVVITKANSKPKTYQVTNDVIALEVANNYTKVIQAGKSYIGLHKFKYDFNNGQIIKK